MVFFTTWYTLRRENQKERIARIADMRRTVFLEAAAENNEALTAILRMASIKVTDEELLAMSKGHSAATMKLRLVGDEETIEKSYKFEQAHFAAATELWPKRINLQRLNAEWEALNKNMNFLNAKIANARETGDNPPIEQNLWIEMVKHHSSLTKQITDEGIALADRAHALWSELAILETALILPMRKQLELGDQEGAQRVLNREEELQRENLKKAMTLKR